MTKNDKDARLKKLEKVAKHLDTCEMGPNIRITLVNPGSGQRDAVWLIGGKDGSLPEKSAKPKPSR
jgi:hypothetical protein